MSTELPLGPGATGEAVRDLHRRLGRLGYPSDDEPGLYGPGTELAVRRFQDARGLDVDGRCGPQTWGAMVEAGYCLGDRLLYLRSPMLRGDDVADLQLRLGQLGFDAGRVDGILGPDTERALRDFQRNSALTTDGVCGRDTLHALQRLRSADDASTAVMGVREREALLDSPRRLPARRIVIGETGGLDALADALAHRLQRLGAVVAVLHHPDPSEQARQANDFEAHAFVGLSVVDDTACRTSYFATSGFESSGGRRLAECVLEAVAPVLEEPLVALEGKRLPLLRETRMPAVICRIGPPAVVVARSNEVAAALAVAVRRWVEDPV